MPTLPEVHRRGTRAQQPAANTVSVGCLYHVTNEGRTERSNGSAWESWTDTAATLRTGEVDATQELADLRTRVDDLERRVVELSDPTGTTGARKRRA